MPSLRLRENLLEVVRVSLRNAPHRRANFHSDCGERDMEGIAGLVMTFSVPVFRTPNRHFCAQALSRSTVLVVFEVASCVRHTNRRKGGERRGLEQDRLWSAGAMSSLLSMLLVGWNAATGSF